MLTSNIRTIFLVWATSVLLSSHLVSTESFFDVEAGSGEACTATSCVGNRACSTTTNTCQCLTGYTGTNCDPVSCGEPTITNGALMTEAQNPYQYDKTIIVSCATDYSLRGTPLIRCAETANWVVYTTGTDYPSCVLTTVAGCASNPCQNGGVCLDTNTNTGAYQCTCTGSYSGTDCATATSANVVSQQFTITTTSVATFTSDMADTQSKAFRETCEILSEQLGTEFKTRFPTTYQSLQCVRLSEGSVKTEFAVSMDPSTSHSSSDVLTQLNDALTDIQANNNGSDPLLIFVPGGASVDKLTTDTTTTSTGLLALYIGVAFLALLIIILIILIFVFRQRRRRRQKARGYHPRSGESYSEEEEYELDSMGRPRHAFNYPSRRGAYYWRPPPRDMMYNTMYVQAPVAAVPGPSWEEDTTYDWSALRGNNVNMLGSSWMRTPNYFI